ncbi:MAG: galactokinase [Clostridiales bacterium]|nr:galactokinase [Clostridiales bacterium]
MQENINLFLSGVKARELFSRLYGNNQQVIDHHTKRYTTLAETFKKLFPYDQGEYHFFSSPGRTEVGGNHTDHNAGRVLAAAVHLDTIAVVKATDNNQITMYSEGYPELFKVDLSQLEPIDEERGTTTALIRGIAARFRQLGLSIGGFNAAVSSTVAKGSGLSSSASIEVLIGTILSALYNGNSVKPDLIAKIGQFAETVYFGKPSGLMDQMACAIGGFIAIDFKDKEKVVYQKLDFDLSSYGYHMLVVDTGGNHADLTRDYAEVALEMKTIAQILGKNVLRELSLDDIIRNTPVLREKAGDRAVLRAIHFYNDNQRVIDQTKALEEKRFYDFLSLVNDSGSSSWRLLQNCYSNYNPKEQGVTLALAITENFIKKAGEGACRVHGGGFAGTIQVYLPDKYLNDYIEIIKVIFGKGAVHTLNIRSQGSLYINDLLK